MYVAVTGSGKYKVIQFREDIRVPGTNKKKTKVIKTIGNYEKMLEEDPDVISKLKEEALRITHENKMSKAPITLKVSSDEITSPEDVVKSFKFGHGLIKEIWKEMKLENYFLEKCDKRNAKSIEKALFYLTSHRCTNPLSIYSSASEQTFHAGLEPVGLDVMYKTLEVLSDQKEELIKHIADFFEKKTNRSGPEAYYDVTTYSFESTKWGELRLFGFSKDHKNNEVQVVMGLLLDNNGIPITYEIFPGNTMDQNTLKKSVENLKKLYKLDKITLVADRGLNSGNNLEYLCNGGHDFVISYTLKRSAQTFKQLVWEKTDWQEKKDETGEIIYKSKVIESVLEVKVPIKTENKENKRGRPKKYDKINIPVKIHLTWSKKRAEKDKSDRERILEKLKKRLDKPYQLKAAIKRGSNQYLQMEIDTEGWKLDDEKIIEASRYDGYYAIITNNLNLDTEKVSDIYNGLWKIEDSFRVLKTDLKARPVFVWSDEHIKGHFAMCFISLCIIRYFQYLLKEHKEKNISACKIMKALNEPTAIVQGSYPDNLITPIKLSQTYIDLSMILKRPLLKTNMTLTQFRACTKLDLSKNLKI